MTDKELKIRYNEICSNLAGSRLKPAFDQIENFIIDSGMPIYTDEWRTLEQTYHYMLQYTVEGIKDPDRQKVYQKLIISVFELTDKIYDAVRQKKSQSLEFEKKRAFEVIEINNVSEVVEELEAHFLHNELISFAEENDITGSTKLDDAKNHQQKMVQHFYRFWFLNQLKVADQELFLQILNSEQIEVPYKSLLVSAVTLSLQRYFDEAKFNMLFDAIENSNSEINQRAFVGLLVNLFKYDARLPFYNSVISRLKLLSETSGFKQNFERVIIQLISSRETEKIQQMIKDEIIPEMIKISPNLKDKINLQDLMNDSTGDDKNPEWEEIFKDSPGLMNKMEEFSELQMEGADVFMGSFSMLKSFPFFYQVHNWFMPFFTGNPEVGMQVSDNDKSSARFMEAINLAPILCNSDKYSFCFSIKNLPKANRDFMAEGMNAEMSQFNEMQNDEELTDPGKKSGFISNQVIQDLYRFYKLHPRKADFEDVFGWLFDFHNKNVLGDILKEDDKILRNIAEYYFKKNYFEEAAEIFRYMLTIEENGELYQKLGYCYQKSGDFTMALNAYKKAELFDLNLLWNFKKIALCYRNLKEPQKALDYYLMAESLDEADLSTELNIGHCYLELEQFEEALKYYFKVEYLAPDNKKVWRPIGWCSFVTGNKQQALKYFKKLLDDEPTKHDLMNMGHVQWSLGKRKQALEFYKKSIAKTDFTEQEFFEVFDEDLRFLLKQGVEKEDVPIMLDQLRYFVEE